jgi:hypothetical protein
VTTTSGPKTTASRFDTRGPATTSSGRTTIPKTTASRFDTRGPVTTTTIGSTSRQPTSTSRQPTSTSRQPTSTSRQPTSTLRAIGDVNNDNKVSVSDLSFLSSYLNDDPEAIRKANNDPQFEKVANINNKNDKISISDLSALASKLVK